MIVPPPPWPTAVREIPDHVHYGWFDPGWDHIFNFCRAEDGAARYTNARDFLSLPNRCKGCDDVLIARGGAYVVLASALVELLS